MIPARTPDRRQAKLMVVDAGGEIRHRPRNDLATLFAPGDVIVANDAATLPASLSGIHLPSGAPLEIRLAGWIAPRDPTQFVAVAFGAGDYRTRTEHRPAPPTLAPGDHLKLGPLQAVITELRGHPRLLTLRLLGDADTILAGVAQHGRPIQYAHVPEPLVLWDVWTRFAAAPFAFEAPSAAFALDWRTLTAWRERGLQVVTLTHAAGISSTGDAGLDLRLPFDEHFRIPPATAAAVARARAAGRRVIAIGTTVVRALESAADNDGNIGAGDGIACGRIGPDTVLGVVDAILTGAHEPGESHFELLRAFTDDAVLEAMSGALEDHHYRGHEFGDSVLIERAKARRRPQPCRSISVTDISCRNAKAEIAIETPAIETSGAADARGVPYPAHPDRAGAARL